MGRGCYELQTASGSEALGDTEKRKELNRGEVCSGAENEGTEKVN